MPFLAIFRVSLSYRRDNRKKSVKMFDKAFRDSNH